jgi:hypothetical protein
MRFLTNENISVTVVRVLREHGYDVLAVKDSMRSEMMLSWRGHRLKDDWW